MIGHAGVPIDLGRDQARELARQELSQPGYQRDVSWPQRGLEWLLEQFNRLVNGAAESIPGGLATVLILAAVAAIAVLIVLRTGPLARRRAGKDPIFADERRSAADYRAAADAAAQAGEWSLAVIERFRAVVAHLEERGVIEARSGRTADEVARGAGDLLPSIAPALLDGARLFDRVLYGGRAATNDDDAAMRNLDDAARRARVQAAPERDPSLAVPQ